MQLQLDVVINSRIIIPTISYQKDILDVRVVHAIHHFVANIRISSIYVHDNKGFIRDWCIIVLIQDLMYFVWKKE